MNIRIWFKKIWAKLFQKKQKFSSDDISYAMSREEINFLISKRIYNLSKDGRIEIYNGTFRAIEKASANPTSEVFVVEIINPPKKEHLIKFREYVSKLRENIFVNDKR